MTWFKARSFVTNLSFEGFRSSIPGKDSKSISFPTTIEIYSIQTNALCLELLLVGCKLFFQLYFVVIWFYTDDYFGHEFAIIIIIPIIQLKLSYFEQRNKRIFKECHFLSITCNPFAEVKGTL